MYRQPAASFALVYQFAPGIDLGPGARGPSTATRMLIVTGAGAATVHLSCAAVASMLPHAAFCVAVPGGAGRALRGP